MRTVLIMLLALTLVAPAFAESLEGVAEAFKSVKVVSVPSIVVPTVVEVPIESGVATRNEFAVYEVATGQFVPHIMSTTYQTNPTLISAYTDNGQGALLVDGREETRVDFFLEEERESTARIILSSETLLESSALTIALDRYVALPVRVSISALVDGTTERIIVAPTTVTGTTITFPKVSANQWIVTLSYIQPLRISELRLSQDKVESTVKRGVRFLAQPGMTYQLYHDPDRFVSVPTLESGNLRDDVGVKLLSPVTSERNMLYREADVDGDGIVDLTDNCVQVPNADQVDIDRNGRGDACDDFDRDGVIQSKDNCPNHTNRTQVDTDGDDIGDACDTEESRVTEKYPWIPWAGMGIALLVLLTLFVLVGTTPKKGPGMNT